MSPASTTYKHDYIDPREMGLKFRPPAPPAKSCGCQPDEKKPISITQPEPVQEDHLKSEWTGVAPMGKLLQPKIVLNVKQPDEADEDGCTGEKSVKFLDNVSNTYPTMFDELKKMNRSDLEKITNVDRLKTTYQVDYGGMSEYASRLNPENVIDEDDLIAEMKHPCTECVIADCRKTYKEPKPFQHIYRARVVCNHCPVKREVVYTDIEGLTEYKSKVGQVGEVIMCERLNDHAKCKNKCVHSMRYSLFK